MTAEDWIPVDDAPPTPAPTVSTAPTDPADHLLKEFLRSPEGDLREGSLVVRPSLWAALERSIKVLVGLLVFLVPATMAFLLPGDAPNADPAPTLPGVLGALDLWVSIVVPLGAAVAPAIQLAFTRYVLDDEGIRERTQLFSKTERRVSWEKVTALRQRHTLTDRIFRLGRVDVVAYGERGVTLHLVGLHHPEHLRGLVARQMRASASVERLLGND